VLGDHRRMRRYGKKGMPRALVVRRGRFYFRLRIQKELKSALRITIVRQRYQPPAAGQATTMDLRREGFIQFAQGLTDA